MFAYIPLLLDNTACPVICGLGVVAGPNRLGLRKIGRAERNDGRFVCPHSCQPNGSVPWKDKSLPNKVGRSLKCMCKIHTLISSKILTESWVTILFAGDRKEVTHGMETVDDGSTIGARPDCQFAISEKFMDPPFQSQSFPSTVGARTSNKNARAPILFSFLFGNHLSGQFCYVGVL